nr:B3 domain-containing protein At5g38500-like [Coffea arabica]
MKPCLKGHNTSSKQAAKKKKKTSEMDSEVAILKEVDFNDVDNTRKNMAAKMATNSEQVANNMATKKDTQLEYESDCSRELKSESEFEDEDGCRRNKKTKFAVFNEKTDMRIPNFKVGRVVENSKKEELNKEMGKSSSNDDERRLDYSVAEVERIRLEEEEKERKLRRNLSTFLKLLAEKEQRNHQWTMVLLKPQSKRLRSPSEENSTDHQEIEMPRSKKAKSKPGYPDGPSKSTINTDVNTHFSRLLVPFKQIKSGFLTPEEQARFWDPNQKFGIDAIFVDPSLDEGRMNLRRWEMGKKDGKISYNFALISNWIKVVAKNELRQLWAFRRDLQLGFALILV